MQNVKQEITSSLRKILEEMGIKDAKIELNHPQNSLHGDYTSNIAMAIFASSKFKVQSLKFKTPMELATNIVEKLKSQNSKVQSIERMEAASPGFINIFLSKDFLVTQLQEVLDQKENFGKENKAKKEKIIVEYAHPNTHKEMHVGHMRTLITGEVLARLFEAGGNEVFRANYQGDIGPHVAKAIYGIQKIMEEENLTLEEIDKRENSDKVNFLGKGYVRGNQDYEENKDEIDVINKQLYETMETALQGVPLEANDDLKKLYQVTRQWSLNYYEDFYKRFYTKFDKLFFESEVADCGKKIVKENAGKIFEEDDGAIIFRGEKFGLHTRVFVTKQGYPTYEGKEMCLGFKQYESFPFDKIIHVVGSEQAGYFKVVFKALELIDPEKFKDTQFHVSMGMVNIVGMKISSRTGEILRVDTLIDKVKKKVIKLVKMGKIKGEDANAVSEKVAIGAIKYSVLKVGTGQNVEFDIERSVALDGDSGPYLQYTYARTQSVLAKVKSQKSNYSPEIKAKEVKSQKSKLEQEEVSLLRMIYIFPEVIEDSARNMSPNTLTNYLFDLAKKFNLFYQKHQIIGNEAEDFRLGLTTIVGQTLKNGLFFLGIEAPERM
ncbi:MAG: arginine--tRNA ligase [Candidatus Levybacteria bacterium]|nr:arginine--tRNA ligase [Candidatus Levybacteria bacterium]